MPRPNHGDVYDRKTTDQVALDWISHKNLKVVKMANNKEAFRLNKIKKALSSIESLHRSCWLREERKVKRNLKRLAVLSHPLGSQTLFQSPSGNSRTGSRGVDSTIQLPVAHLSRASREDGSSCSLNTPPLRTPQSTADLSPRPSRRALALPLPIRNTFSPQPLLSRETPSETSSTSWRGMHYRGLTPRPSRYPSTVSMTPRESSTTPLLPTSSMLILQPPHLTPDHHGFEEAALGFPLLQRRVRESITWSRATEQERQERRSLTLCPLEALRCRYLRLSESNIITLLQQCKDSGIDTDFHPHMKYSEIDISKLLKLFSTTIP